MQPAIPFGVVGRLPIAGPSRCAVVAAVDGGVIPLPPQHPDGEKLVPKVVDGADISDEVPRAPLFERPDGGARLSPAL